MNGTAATGSNAVEPTDEALVGAAKAGDRRALEMLLRRHHPRLLALCRRMCRDPGDAEDAAQNALLAVVRGLDRFDARSRFSTWSHRVAANSCLDELRRRERRPVPAEHDSASPSTDPGPEAAVESAADRERLLLALAELPAEFRDAVVLRDVLDLDYGRIAAELDVPVGTVRSRIARGRARLAIALDADPLIGNRPGPAGVEPEESR